MFYIYSWLFHCHRKSPGYEFVYKNEHLKDFLYGESLTVCTSI